MTTPQGRTRYRALQTTSRTAKGDASWCCHIRTRSFPARRANGSSRSHHGGASPAASHVASAPESPARPSGPTRTGPSIRQSTAALPGTVWLATREHVDSFVDLPDALAADFGRIVARVERAILSLGGVARVHLYRYGDGGAHFHVWFMPRPLGMIEARGTVLPIWEDVLPKVPDEELLEAARRVAGAMDAPRV